MQTLKASNDTNLSEGTNVSRLCLLYSRRSRNHYYCV